MNTPIQTYSATTNMAHRKNILSVARRTLGTMVLGSF